MTKEPIKWLGYAGCDFCNVDCTTQKFFVDAKTKGSTRWALMCPTCYKKRGIPVGQKYGPDKVKICDLHS